MNTLRNLQFNKEHLYPAGLAVCGLLLLANLALTGYLLYREGYLTDAASSYQVTTQHMNNIPANTRYQNYIRCENGVCTSYSDNFELTEEDLEKMREEMQEEMRKTQQEIDWYMSRHRSLMGHMWRLWW